MSEEVKEYDRPRGWTFAFKGVNLTSPPDKKLPGKFSSAVNIRAVGPDNIQTREGYTVLQTGLGPLTDCKAYSTLGTDSLPQFLLRNTSNEILLASTGGVVATLGGAVGSGVRMVSFRPGANAQSWMYVAGLGDYQKLSAPAPTVTAQKVGIAEPFPSALPTPVVQAQANPPVVQDFTGVASGWSASGTAGSLSNGNLLSDTAGSVLSDPIVSALKSVQVGLPGLYIQGMELLFGGGTQVQVQAVLPASSGATISGVRYYSGTSGPCMISFTSDISGQLQRGSIVRINSTENVLVLSVISGPLGTSCIETSTSGSYSSGSITGVPAVLVYGSVTSGQAITSPTVDSSVTTGTGTITQSLGSNPFSSFSGNDYVHVLLLINNIGAVTNLTLTFNQGANNLLTYSLSGSALALQAVAGEIFVVSFAISQLTGWTGMMPQNITSFSASVTTTATTTLDVGSCWVGGGSNPDIGTSGAPYMYVVKPRSSLTGAQGNPSAFMRYGVYPRRQSVTLSLPSASYDSQIDTWDIYRYGGTLTTYLYLGSQSTTSSTFVDNLFDTDIEANQGLVEDDFEPWPSIGLPVAAAGTSVQVTGTWCTLTASSYPPQITQWLPGTLLNIGGNVFTLRSRPFGTGPYSFEVQECIGHYFGAVMSVTEPLIAREILPYVWGPDAQGVVFGAGDPLRPGTIQFAKANEPDQVSDQNTIELSSPSEPQLGGEVMDGISYCASTLRWWALYPSLPGSQTETTTGSVISITVSTSPYNPQEIPVGEPLASPYGHCTDGEKIYFWGKTGIFWHSGGPAQSLTQEDLYTIFPHDGENGKNLPAGGATFFAPDYSRAATFRLAWVKPFLYADYQDSTGNPRTLVWDSRTGGWSQDSYANSVSLHYAVEDQVGTLESSPQVYARLVMGDLLGNFLQSSPSTNDAGTTINALIYTPEWDGGDPRALVQFGDFYLDCVTPPGLSIQPVSQGANLGSPTAVSGSNNRQFAVVSLGGGELEKFVGLVISWTDNFSTQSFPTTLYLWQGSAILKPETSQDRFSDWQEGPGGRGNKFWQGCILHADTFDASKVVEVRDSDSFTLHTLQPSPIVLNGENRLALSFGTPFYAHMVRLEPQDKVPWRLFDVEWKCQPAPENVQTWVTPFSSFGLPGYKSLPWIDLAYRASDNVTLSFSVVDGTAPQSISLPSTGSAPYQTLRVFLTPNKGLAYQFSATSSGDFQIFLEDWTFWVAPWGRKGALVPWKALGGHFGPGAEI